jgi:amino acid adenylation domain-containing protein
MTSADLGPAELVDEVESRGLSIGLAGADLRLQGPKERMDADLVGRIKAMKPELIAYLEARRADEQRGFGLTLLQRGYLIGRGGAVEMGNVASHVYREIEGCWDLERLEASLRHVVNRHGMLRTRFTDDGHQIEMPAPVEVGLGVLDLRGESEESQRERLAELRAERSHRIFPADRAPMLAADVTVLADDRMLLHVGTDGLVMDGISMFLFFRDWFEAYTKGAADGLEEASFEAYVAALETARTRAPYARSKEYWLARLDDLAPHPDLPLATTPSAITHPRLTQHAATLGAEQWSAIKAKAAAAGVTPTVLLLTAYAEVLSRWGAGRRFTLATTLANRPPIHPRIYDAIGCFSETMLVEVEVDRTRTFEERAQALQAQLRRDIDNRHFSGIEVLRELGKRPGGGGVRMPYTFNSTIGYIQNDLDGSTFELFGREIYNSSQTPQVWLNSFTFEQHGGVVVQFDSVDGLFPPRMVEDMVAGYQKLLEALADEETWQARRFDLLPDDQKARRQAANDTFVARPRRLLQDAIVARAEEAPEAVAIVTSTGEMTYGELYRRACAAATWLRSWKVGRDELVGLVMSRGPEQIVGILATVMAGGAYLPIDAHLPAERKRYMLRDGRVRCVITNVEADEPLGDDLEVLRLDLADPAEADSMELYLEAPGAEPDDLAYVLYTSGTTGEPKGVMVSHASVANVVADCNERFGVGPSDRLFGISAFNFDLSVYDIFGGLAAGGAIVMPDHDKAADPSHWLELARRGRVTIWNSVPAIVGLLHDQAVADGATLPETLRLVMMSGDRIPPLLPSMLRALKPDLEVMSQGGPTETTIWNIGVPIGPEWQGETLPYGTPNANNRAYILDHDDQDTPDWVTGEIGAAGTGLARGYWGDEARTAQRFFEDPNRGVAGRGERIFRTGDLGRWLPDGNIGILGRSDFQIKVNGYRIEAGEVETRLVAITGIRQAAVTKQTGAHGDRLVAHVVAEGDERKTEEAIRQQLRQHLPDYMTPTLFLWHESLPLSRNGKVDRQKLVALSDAAAGGTQATHDDGPLSELEEDVVRIWASVLRIPESEVVPSVNLADLGGDSLAAVRILTGVRKQFGVGITLDQIFDVDTVRRMAAYIEAAGPQ